MSLKETLEIQNLAASDKSERAVVQNLLRPGFQNGNHKSVLTDSPRHEGQTAHPACGHDMRDKASNVFLVN